MNMYIGCLHIKAIEAKYEIKYVSIAPILNKENIISDRDKTKNFIFGCELSTNLIQSNMWIPLKIYNKKKKKKSEVVLVILAPQK